MTIDSKELAHLTIVQYDGMNQRSIEESTGLSCYGFAHEGQRKMILETKDGSVTVTEGNWVVNILGWVTIVPADVHDAIVARAKQQLDDTANSDSQWVVGIKSIISVEHKTNNVQNDCLASLRKFVDGMIKERDGLRMSRQCTNEVIDTWGIPASDSLHDRALLLGQKFDEAEKALRHIRDQRSGLQDELARVTRERNDAIEERNRLRRSVNELTSLRDRLGDEIKSFLAATANGTGRHEQ